MLFWTVIFLDKEIRKKIGEFREINNQPEI